MSDDVSKKLREALKGTDAVLFADAMDSQEFQENPLLQLVLSLLLIVVRLESRIRAIENAAPPES